MAVPFYLPEGGVDDTVSTGAGTSSDGVGSAGSSLQSSPHTTSSATQTPMQSPLVPGDLVMAFCEAFYRYSMNNGKIDERNIFCYRRIHLHHSHPNYSIPQLSAHHCNTMQRTQHKMFSLQSLSTLAQTLLRIWIKIFDQISSVRFFLSSETCGRKGQHQM